MNEQSVPTTRQTGLRFGLYTGLVLVIYSIILQLTGLALNTLLSSLSYLLLLIGIVLAHREFKQEGDGTMSFGQGITIGVVLSFIAGILSGIFSYVYMAFIDPSVMDKVMEQQMQSMADRGMSEEQIEQAMEMTEKFMQPEFAVPIGIVSLVFLGLVISVIVSIFTKQD